LFFAEASKLNNGPVDQRLDYIVLAGEIIGPKMALEKLQELDRAVTENSQKLTSEQESVRRLLGRLYADYTEKNYTLASVSAAEIDLLKKQLGWFGELALAPAAGKHEELRKAIIGPAEKAVGIVLACLAVVGIVGFLGTVGLCVFLFLMFTGKLVQGVHSGSPYGGIYVETFALWLAFLAGIRVLITWVSPGGSDLLVSGIVSLVSLVALFWPVVRGIPWSQVRQDIGLTMGRQPLMEPIYGVAGYAMALPLAFVGILITLVLINATTGTGADGDAFGRTPIPAHPIIGVLAGADWWGRVQVFVLGCLVAPIVEEIMFRGLLYRHIREWGGRTLRGFSIMLGALLVSFLFALIHPQGFLAIPPLMALAIMFALLREWRGSLVPAMVAHGINNGLLLTFFTLMFSR
jgi:membrane protease YdiL (CAAX protease family)